MNIFIKCLMLTIVALITLPIITLVVLYKSADMGEPKLHVDTTAYRPHAVGDTLFCGGSYLRHDSQTKLWELYVSGSGQERGAMQGALTKDLMKYQEDVFINQIRRIIPSDSYLSLLRNFIVIFNRNLGEYIPLEYRNEIVAMSEFCTDDYNAIGSPYERQLNYHAAHDIGHTMQQYMLVGCSSFGVWGTKSADGTLLIGRNFDFYVGDDFAKNKIITFASPLNGYRYASVGWAGMIGVLSGINQKGLTVTINAAKGAIPSSAAMPISILAREILQYAATIDEAFTIANNHKTFVNESILIGSQQDHRAAIIEKTPHETSLYTSPKDQIICTNHFQSEAFAKDEYNIENLEFSDSKYRYDRVVELLRADDTIDYKRAIDILRDRYGKDNRDIGVGNEMTLNQSIAHHSVVFSPHAARMWVSTSPWQSGEFVCYDLSGFFTSGDHPTIDSQLNVAADSNFINSDLPRLLEWREGIGVLKSAIWNESKGCVDNNYIERLIEINANHYYTYQLAGDFYRLFNDKATALRYYQKALDCEIPYKSERLDIEKTIKRLQ